jgi:uncharacterized protein (DUF58 family)
LKRLRLAAAWRLRTWAGRRHGIDTLPLTVQLRRIYILPTGSGLVLGVMVVAMLLAGLNYNSNLGLAFGFLMASIAMTAMHHCHRNLLGLKVDIGLDADGMAGASAPIGFVLLNDSAAARHDIEVRCGDGAEVVTAVAGGAARKLEVALPTPVRGVLDLRQCELATRWPLGWFRAWTYVQAPIRVHVAPRPGGSSLPPASAALHGERAQSGRRGDDDFAGLSPYTPGIPLKHLAWKTLARGQPAAVRTYVDASGSPVWLEYAALPGLSGEARLSQLCRWILDSEAAGQPYGLRLPGLELAVGQLGAHRTACLRALAAFVQEPGA